jgi:hypothetical protein
VCRATKYILLLALLFLPVHVSSASTPTSLLPWKIVGSISFGDDDAKSRFEHYVAHLESDREKFVEEIATLRQLDASEIEYHVRIVDIAEPSIGGRLSTDGERVFVNVSGDTSRATEIGSINSRFAHELEHARQFDSGELGFERDKVTGVWRPAHASYDIGDEVKAWQAQLRTALNHDFWTTINGRRKPSLLRLFSNAKTDQERETTLLRNGYRERNPISECNVVFETTSGYVARQVIRPTPVRNFFGRVFGTVEGLAAMSGSTTAAPDQTVTIR